MKIILSGFRFGIILQLAIGPVCLFILDEATKNGFISSMIGVLAVTLVDSIYIFLAISGASAVLRNVRVQRYVRISGFLIILLFGIDMLLGSMGIRILPVLSVSCINHESFIKGILITASNPLTILFWTGVFSIELDTECFSTRDMYYFGSGALSATVIFLTIIGISGTLIAGILPGSIIHISGAVIGVAFIIFAFRVILKNDENGKEPDETCDEDHM